MGDFILMDSAKWLQGKTQTKYTKINVLCVYAKPIDENSNIYYTL